MVKLKKYWHWSIIPIMTIIMWCMAIYWVSVTQPAPSKRPKINKNFNDIDSMVKRNNEYIDSLNKLIKQLRDVKNRRK